MKIRAMQLKDMEEVVGMMRVFYDSPAVIHAAPDEILIQDVKEKKKKKRKSKVSFNRHL